MKKLDVKSILLGIIIGSLSVCTVSATTRAIKSAQYNETKVIYNGKELELSQPMITVINDNSQYGSNYMPIRSVLEMMEYEVDWDGSNNAVIIKDGDTMEDEEMVNNDTKTYTQLEYTDFINLFEAINYDTETKYDRMYKYYGDLSKKDFCLLLDSINYRDEIIKSLLKDIKGTSNIKAVVHFYYVGTSNDYSFLGSAKIETNNEVIIDFYNVESILKK